MDEYIQLANNNKEQNYQEPETDDLVTKLKNRIYSDIVQINIVYDNQIQEKKEQMEKEISCIKEKYETCCGRINNKRQRDICDYRSKAEKNLSNLLNVSVPSKPCPSGSEVTSYYQYVYNYIFPPTTITS